MEKSSAPPLYSGPFNANRSLGIDRANYIAIHAEHPEAAARFAVENMGFFLVHVDREGRHYLAGHGLDPYSLVYTPGEQGKVDHMSYSVRGSEDLLEAETRLLAMGVRCERVERSPLWRHGPALRFTNSTGQTIELTPGVRIDMPMAALIAEPLEVPGPVAFDHAIVRAVDLVAAYEFAARAMGLKESARIVAPDGVPVLGFFRCHTLFHCYGIARSQYDGLHHMQFSMKSQAGLMQAFSRMKEQGRVELIWGPVRHGCGLNVAFYFRDHTGSIVEYSAEEEIILNDTTYAPRAWQTTDARASDEWNLSRAPAAMTAGRQH